MSVIVSDPLWAAKRRLLNAEAVASEHEADADHAEEQAKYWADWAVVHRQAAAAARELAEAARLEVCKLEHPGVGEPLNHSR